MSGVDNIIVINTLFFYLSLERLLYIIWTMVIINKKYKSRRNVLKNITINDIAQLVGVSKATVSYYLNGNFKKMSIDTRERIRQVIEDTGYEPSKIAQSLVTKDTRTIGVVIADITNPFISSVMKGIHDTCKQEGYSVNFTNSDNDMQIELDNINRLKQQNVSGIILDSVNPNQIELAELSNANTVMVDRQANQLSIDTVVSDNEVSTKNFLNMMQQQGYQDIYFVSFPIEGISTREIRYEGFKKVVSDDPSKLIIVNQVDVVKKLELIIQQSTVKTAFFTMNGPTLLEFMKLINQMQYSYPQDFGLGSYEDLEWMALLNPNVSCICQDSYQIGQQAATRLISKLKQPQQIIKPQLIEVASHIIIRNSF